MSIMSMCLAEVHNEIPEELLTEAFVVPYRTNYFTPVSVDAMIMEKVINKRVMPDLNVTYAVTYKFPLNQCVVKRVGPAEYIIEVPPKVTNNRKIVTVLGISATNPYFYPSNHSEVTHVSSPSPIMSAAQKMANANSGSTLDYNARVQMISPNAFRAHYQGYLGAHHSVELLLEHDANLSNVPINSVDHFKTLVVSAVKSYIYTNLKIKVDRAKLDGGSDLGAFSEFLDSYADANDLYKETLRIAGKISFMNDREGFHDYMRNIFSNTI